MNKFDKDLIYSVHKCISELEWIEIWFLKLLKPKAYVNFINNLKRGYSYWAALKELRSWKKSPKN